MISTWVSVGCKGKFYTRGKNKIIWYRRGTERKSLSLSYSVANKQIASEIIRILLNLM